MGAAVLSGNGKGVPTPRRERRRHAPPGTAARAGARLDGRAYARDVHRDSYRSAWSALTESVAIRALLVADICLLIGVGGVCWMWVQRPAGPVIAGLLWFGCGMLIGLLRWTDPIRAQRRRDHSTW